MHAFLRATERLFSCLLALTLAGALSACTTVAPAPSEASTPDVTLEQLRAAIGQPASVSSISDIENTTGLAPFEIRVFDKGAIVFKQFWSLGISELIDHGIVRTMFIYKENPTTHFSQYRGPLPGGILFSDTRRDVENKLGTPDEIMGGEAADVWTTYRGMKVSVFYDTFDSKDMSANVKSLTIQ